MGLNAGSPEYQVDTTEQMSRLMVLLVGSGEDEHGDRCVWGGDIREDDSRVAESGADVGSMMTEP